jgi:hypothetical protein
VTIWNSARRWRKATGGFSTSRIVVTGEFREFHGVFALHSEEMFREEFQ